MCLINKHGGIPGVVLGPKKPFLECFSTEFLSSFFASMAIVSAAPDGESAVELPFILGGWKSTRSDPGN